MTGFEKLTEFWLIVTSFKEFAICIFWIEIPVENLNFCLSLLNFLASHITLIAAVSRCWIGAENLH